MDERWNYFKCQRCGKCCEKLGLPYDPESVLKIADFLGITIEKLIEDYYGELIDDPKGWISQDKKRTPCPFLQSTDMNKACKIYEVRPEGCRLYPFNTDFGRCGVECPGAEIANDKWKDIHRDELNDKLCGPFGLLEIPFDEKFPSHPVAKIKLCSYTTKKIGEEEYICLSPQCVTYNELKFYVDYLKIELDELAEKGKEFFSKEAEREDKWKQNM